MKIKLHYLSWCLFPLTKAIYGFAMFKNKIPINNEFNSANISLLIIGLLFGVIYYVLNSKIKNSGIRTDSKFIRFIFLA